MEPTPGAGPCLEEIFPHMAERILEIHASAHVSEFNYIELLLYNSRDLRVSIVAFVGSECLEVLGLRVLGCHSSAERILNLISSPESSGGDVWRDCAEARVPADPPYRIIRVLDDLGVGVPADILAYRLLGDHDEVVEAWTGED